MPTDPTTPEETPPAPTPQVDTRFSREGSSLRRPESISPPSPSQPSRSANTALEFADEQRKDFAGGLSKAQKEDVAQATGTGIIFGGMDAFDKVDEPSQQMKNIAKSDVPNWLKPVGHAFAEKGMARRFARPFLGAGAATYVGNRAIDNMLDEDKDMYDGSESGGHVQPKRASLTKAAKGGWGEALSSFGKKVNPFSKADDAADDMPEFRDALDEFKSKQEAGDAPPTADMDAEEATRRVEDTFRDMKLDAAGQKVRNDTGFQIRESLRNFGQSMDPGLDPETTGKTLFGLGLAGTAGVAGNYGYRATQPDVQLSPQKRKEQKQVEMAAETMAHPAGPVATYDKDRGQMGQGPPRRRQQNMRKQSSEDHGEEAIEAQTQKNKGLDASTINMMSAAGGGALGIGGAFAKGTPMSRALPAASAATFAAGPIYNAMNREESQEGGESQLGQKKEGAFYKEGARSLKSLESRESDGTKRVKYQGRWMPVDEPVESWRPGKKRAVLASKEENGERRVKLVHYGSENFDHNYSNAAKQNYLSRARGITDKDGNPTKDDPHSANHWSIKDLWPEENDADGGARMELSEVVDDPPEKTGAEKEVEPSSPAADFAAGFDPFGNWTTPQAKRNAIAGVSDEEHQKRKALNFAGGVLGGGLAVPSVTMGTVSAASEASKASNPAEAVVRGGKGFLEGAQKPVKQVARGTRLSRRLGEASKSSDEFVELSDETMGEAAKGLQGVNLGSLGESGRSASDSVNLEDVLSDASDAAEKAQNPGWFGQNLPNLDDIGGKNVDVGQSAKDLRRLKEEGEIRPEMAGRLADEISSARNKGLGRLAFGGGVGGLGASLQYEQGKQTGEDIRQGKYDFSKSGSVEETEGAKKKAVSKKTASEDKSTYAHRTTEDNLKKVLEDGRLKTLRHLAQDSPDKMVSVEPYPTSLIRRELPAQKAYERMEDIKDVDKTFLTRGGYVGNDNYGENVILKRLSHPEKSENINPVKEEHMTRRPLSVRSNAEIFVPDDRVEEWKKNFEEYDFHPKSELENRDVEEYPSISLRTLGGRIKNKVVGTEKTAVQDTVFSAMSKLRDQVYGDLDMDKEQLVEMAEKAEEERPDPGRIERLFGEKAQVQGSMGLGVNIPGDKSDVDVMIPTENEEEFAGKIDEVREQFSNLSPSPYNKYRDEAYVMTGTVDDEQMDVVVGHGPKVNRRVENYERAKDELAPKDRGRIIGEKKRLKNALVLSKPRYKHYKRKLDEDLEIPRL